MQLFQYGNDLKLAEDKKQVTRKGEFKSKGQIQLNNDFDALNIREDIYNDLLKHALKTIKHKKSLPKNQKAFVQNGYIL